MLTNLSTGDFPEGTPRLDRSELPGLTLVEVEVPPLEKTGGGTGWGSSLLVRSNPPEVFWTRTYGLSPLPWSRYEHLTGEVTTIKGRRGLHGDLRDAIPDSDGRHAWALLTHGLVRLDLQEMSVVKELRTGTGLPTHLWRLRGLDDARLLAMSHAVNGVAVIDRDELRVVKTLRVPPPDLILPIGTNRVAFVAFSAGEVRSVDLTSLRSAAVRPTIIGTGVARVGGEAWLVEGSRHVEPRAPRLRHVRPERLALVDLETLEVKRRGPDFPDAQRVLGVDPAGRVVVKTVTGIAILDPTTLHRLGGVEMRGAFWTAALLPDGHSLAALPNRFGDPERFFVIRW